MVCTIVSADNITGHKVCVCVDLIHDLIHDLPSNSRNCASTQPLTGFLFSGTVSTVLLPRSCCRNSQWNHKERLTCSQLSELRRNPEMFSDKITLT